MSEPLYRFYIYTTIPNFNFRKVLDRIFTACNIKYYDTNKADKSYNGEKYVIFDMDIDDELPKIIDYNKMEQNVIIIKNNTLDEGNKIDQSLVEYLKDYGFRSMFIKSGKLGKAINKLIKIIGGRILIQENKLIKKDAPFDGRNDKSPKIKQDD